jgi:dihydrofolate synthase/folylpolyglutamate synthase
MIEDYAQALDYLYRTLPMFQRVGAAALKNDLTNTLKLCAALDNPQRRFKSVHVAGTNGKGSTSHMLAAILQSAGYKTGLYTSPHLKEFTERIRINGDDIRKDRVIEFVNEMHLLMEEIQPSFFEMTVAMAFKYFADEKVDIAIVEVGLGGRLDSTNVITPELSLITNISLDHTDLLGDTVEKIAAEKAGIIKRSVPVIISERQPGVERVFIERAAHMNAPISFAAERIQAIELDKGFRIMKSGSIWFEQLIPELKGNYQRLNLPGILAAVLDLQTKGFSIPDKAIVDGIEHGATITGLKGRWQKLKDAPLTICDTGHNPDGIREVVAQINATPHKQLHFVIGMVKEKDASAVLRQLPADARYYFCQADIPRAMPADLLAKAAASFGLAGVIIPDVNEAIRAASLNAAKDDLVFIGGSTFVVAEIDGL